MRRLGNFVILLAVLLGVWVLAEPGDQILVALVAGALAYVGWTIRRMGRKV